LNRVSEAIELFNERRVFYKSVDLMIAALNHNQTWYNIRTRVLPVAKGAPTSSERMLEVKDFVIIHERLNLHEFEELLQNINTGIFEIDDLRINFFTNNPIPPLEIDDRHRGDSLWAKEWWNIEWPVDLYEWSQTHNLHNELRNIFKEIDTRIRCSDPPYQNVEEAIVDLLNLPKYHFQEDYCSDSRCSILLPNFMAIETAILKGKKLEITARVHKSLRLDDLLLSVICYGRKTRRFRESLEGGKTAASGSFVRVFKSFERKNVADIQLYLFSKQWEKYGQCDQRSARNLQLGLNPRTASHEVFDEGSAKLFEFLGGKAKNRSRNFEHAVTTLLHLCGFRTEWLGYAGVLQAPDILAFHSDPGLIIVGECTTEVPDVNKYLLLKERAEKLQSHTRINTSTVMFSSIELSADEQTEAFKCNVSFVGPEKLRKLYDMATRDRTTGEMMPILTGRLS
jgi:hypothetical protein